MEIFGFTPMELLTFATLIVGGIVSVVKIYNSQQETKDDILKLEKRLDITLEEIRKEGDIRGKENRMALQEFKKDTHERLTPLEHEVKINATYIASQGATLSSINSQLTNMSNQLSTIISRMMEQR